MVVLSAKRGQHSSDLQLHRRINIPQMPQNEERNIPTDSSSRIVHLQEVLPQKFTIFSPISMITASIAQQWVLVPRIFAALDFPRKSTSRLTRI